MIRICTAMRVMPHCSFSIWCFLGLATLLSVDKVKAPLQKTHDGQTEDKAAKESRSQKHNRVSVCVCVCVCLCVVVNVKGMQSYNYYCWQWTIKHTFNTFMFIKSWKVNSKYNFPLSNYSMLQFTQRFTGRVIIIPEKRLIVDFLETRCCIFLPMSTPDLQWLVNQATERKWIASYFSCHVIF